MKISIIGTGYVGLVTGACLADFGNEVVCVDTNHKKTADLKKGMVDFYELGLKELVLKNIKGERLRFLSNFSNELLMSKVIFIAVGTPSRTSGEADLSAVDTAALQVAKILKSSKKTDKSFRVIAVKSTVPVGTAERIKKILIAEKINPKSFAIASNPEFLREGKAVADFLHPDRIVIGASSNQASNIMAELYRPLNARIVFMGTRSAELVKYASNVFLANRISLINEISNICESIGANIQEVIEGIGHDKRIGHTYLKPGIGYGGSCLPKDVSALIKLATGKGYNPILLKGIESVNNNQRGIFIHKVEQILSKINGKNIGIWGLSFKPQTDDLRDAPAMFVMKHFLNEGIKIKAYDPLANSKAKEVFPQVKYCSSPYAAAYGSDLLLVITEWNEFREADFERVRKGLKHPIIVDARNILDSQVMKNLKIDYYKMGSKK